MTKRKESGKVLKDKTFKIGRLYGSYERGLASAMFFNKKSSGSGAKSMLNPQIADELLKQLQNLKESKTIFYLKIIFGVLSCWCGINKQRIRFSLCVINHFSKYARVVCWQDKKGRKA